MLIPLPDSVVRAAGAAALKGWLVMTKKQTVKIGQIYKERDGRFTRYTLILNVDQRYAYHRTCTAEGVTYDDAPRTRIGLDNLSKRFELFR